MPAKPDALWALRGLTLAPRAGRDFAAMNVRVKSQPIYARGAPLVDRVLDSCAKLQPVQLCLPVDRSILDARTDSLVDTPKDNLDIGHAVTVVAARSPSRGDRLPELKIFTNWKGNPFLWITGEYAGTAYSVRDVVNVTGWA